MASCVVVVVVALLLNEENDRTHSGWMEKDEADGVASLGVVVVVGVEA